MNNTTLHEYLEALRCHDQEAFTAIYEELKVPVFTIAFRILCDSSQAEDVVHDVFVKLYQSPPLPQIENPRAWIFQIARNHAIDLKRKSAADDLPEDDLLPDRQQNEGLLEDLVSSRIDLEHAMNALPVAEREILTLHLNADLRFREIAQLLAIPLGTVLWKYRRGLMKVRNDLKGDAL